jgi:hypothetical protein
MLTACVLVGLALPILGQAANSAQTQPCKVSAASTQSKPPILEPKPYLAEFKTTRVQTLANGATITTESTRVRAMDSQRRLMTSYTQIQYYGDHSLLNSVSVTDMEAGTHASWNSQSKKATIVKEPPAEQRHGCWQSESGHYRRDYPGTRMSGATVQNSVVFKPATPAPVPQVQRQTQVMEDLGTMTIQGLEARGRRWTITTPAGEIGNDQPLVVTSEDWFANGYGFSARSIRDDPQQGKETTELTKFETGEPDPDLFLPPEGYETVVEEMVPCKEQ